MVETLPRHYVFGSIIFMTIIAGGILVAAVFNHDKSILDGDSQYQNFNATFNKYNDLESSMQTLEDAASQTNDVNPGLFGFLDSLVGISWNTLTSIGTTFGFMKTSIGGLSSIFGIPDFIVTAIILLISAMIVFSIFSAIFQREV